MTPQIIQQVIGPNVSAHWVLYPSSFMRVLELAAGGRGRPKLRVLLDIESSGPVFVSVTDTDPKVYIARRLPPTKSWPVSAMLFDSFMLDGEGPFHLVISNSGQVPVTVRGKYRTDLEYG